eukprot:61618_1
MVYVFFAAYMIVDMILHLYFYCKYPAKLVRRRYDTLIHHLCAALPLFLFEIPDPLYAWAPINCIIGIEISTIFLNLQWFLRYFEHTAHIKWSKIAFLLTWFMIRVPVISYSGWWLIYNW